ncbi:hypothetical protein [Vibrio gallaecicus]|uniref:Uncharacterized protein n=1 Tax=Vibrio gallaecicus TaxID=552386 RepID=A0ABV4NHN6_9VIBR
MESVKSIYGEIKLYFVSNWLVNAIAGIAVAIIVLFQIMNDMPVPQYLNAEVVNYYFDILVNLSLGYLVGTIFYILVVYYPERKKERKKERKELLLAQRPQFYFLVYSCDLNWQ